MRLDVPKFLGVDPKSWLFSINEYFIVLNTLADQWLRIVGFNLKGVAAEWFRWMTQNGLKSPLQRELLVSKPTTLVAKTPLLPAPPKAIVSANSKPAVIKWISSAKRQDRLNNDEGSSEEVAAGDDEVIGPTDVHVLIDNESTYNFVRLDVVKRMWLPLKETKAFEVYIRREEMLLCENVCSRVNLNMQRLEVEVDLYVLPMQGPDVVLRIC
nr:prolyl oligopeptidase family protein [Tanacetum cinerariifolium]